MVRFFEFRYKQDIILERFSLYSLAFLFLIAVLLYIITIEEIIVNKNSKFIARNKELLSNKFIKVETSLYHLEKSTISTPRAPLVTNSEETKQLLVKLKDLKDANWFLNPDIDLQSLADATKTNATFISEVLNLELGVNFNTYVNDIRIKYVVESMRKQTKKDASLSIEEFYIQAGFKSKSTFNRHFKRTMNQTPTQFIDSLEKHI